MVSPMIPNEVPAAVAERAHSVITTCRRSPRMNARTAVLVSRAALEETVIEAQGVVERVHFVVVEHADPVVQLGDVDAEHLL